MIPEIVILGSGAGFSTRERFCTSVAVLAEPHLYLLDCGEPAAALLRRAGIDIGALRALFVSHLHADHVGGLPQIVSAFGLPARGSVKKFKPWSVSSDDPWYRDGITFPAAGVPSPAAGRRHLDILMPAAGIDPAQRFLEALYLGPARLPFDLAIAPAHAGAAYADDLVRLTAASNDHLNVNPSYRDLPAERRESFSYRLDIAGRVLVFSGDVNRPEDLAPLLEGTVDTLVVEAAHYDPAGLRDCLAGFDIGRVVISHVHPGLEARVATLVRDWADDRFTIARDGMRFPLGRTDHGT